MFLRTEEDKKLEYSDCTASFVKPVDDGKWVLCVNRDIEKLPKPVGPPVEKLQTPGPLKVATFNSVDDANSAKASLDKAIEENIGWDAIEFKKQLEQG